MTTPAVHIDIVSDVVCPWCAIGYKRLERALAGAVQPVAARLEWQPFELNRGLPPGGQDAGEHLREKYGATLEQAEGMRRRLTEIAASVGFAVDYSPDMRIYDTFDAHRLLCWAGGQYGGDRREPSERGRSSAESHTRGDAQTRLALSLFTAYFIDRLAVDDGDVLVDAAVRAGLDGREARTVLERGDFADAVRAAERRWLQRGVRSVPTFVFGGRRAVTGAQEVAVFEDQLRALRQTRADEVFRERRVAETPGFEPGNEPLTR